MMYESGYSLKLYQILENDLIDFLNYIPIDYYYGIKRKEIFSPKLSEFLIRVGSQVDIFFRNWDLVHDVYKSKKRVRTVALKKLDIKNYKDIEKEGKIKLSDKTVKILSTDEIIKPFEYWGDQRYPLWWKAYNNVKHDGFTHKKHGNLYNTIESLAALFLINCIHEDTKIKLIEYGYRKVNLDTYDTIIRQKSYFEPANPYITSKIFEYKITWEGLVTVVGNNVICDRLSILS